MPLLLLAQATPSTAPSFRWALLHNWLYFLSLGLSVPSLPRVISSIVNADGSTGVTPASIKVSGDVETVDKALTFLGVGFLCALSDVMGRRALMAWSALGFGLTCLLQATCRSSVRALFLADIIDGVSLGNPLYLYSRFFAYYCRAPTQVTPRGGAPTTESV